MYTFSYDCDLKQVEKDIDGLIIPGGRDLNPMFYNQDCKGSVLEEDSNHRYPFMKDLYLKLDKEIPIFGICWGIQFLNVVHGGNLNQHIEDSKSHYTQRRMFVRERSWFREAVGESLIGQCYHHQGLDIIGQGLDVCIVDDHSNEPHGVQLKDPNRWVKAVLWHPEHTYQDETQTTYDHSNLVMMQEFVKVCGEYKKRKDMNK